MFWAFPKHESCVSSEESASRSFWSCLWLYTQYHQLWIHRHHRARHFPPLHGSANSGAIPRPRAYSQTAWSVDHQPVPWRSTGGSHSRSRGHSLNVHRVDRLSISWFVNGHVLQQSSRQDVFVLPSVGQSSDTFHNGDAQRGALSVASWHITDSRRYEATHCQGAIVRGEHATGCVCRRQQKIVTRPTCTSLLLHVSRSTATRIQMRLCISRVVRCKCIQRRSHHATG